MLWLHREVVTEEKLLVSWDERTEPASETVKIISFKNKNKKPYLFCKNPTLGRTYCNLKVTKSFIKNEVINYWPSIARVASYLVRLLIDSVYNSSHRMRTLAFITQTRTLYEIGWRELVESLEHQFSTSGLQPLWGWVGHITDMLTEIVIMIYNNVKCIVMK